MWGVNFPVFIIAEIGINHMGSEKLCKKLILAAKRSGADAVKLQIIDPEYSYCVKILFHIKSLKKYFKRSLP